jgi:hypothetical protein
MSENQQGLESWLKLSSPLLAIAAFVWGIYVYGDTARQQLIKAETDTQRLAQTRRIEATRPFLDKQLALYTEATKLTATIATSADQAEIQKATKRFRELYWGELGLVERDDVARAMISFKQALDAKQDQDTLASLALSLAHACRDELAASWGTDAWKRNTVSSAQPPK